MKNYLKTALALLIAVITAFSSTTVFYADDFKNHKFRSSDGNYEYLLAPIDPEGFVDGVDERYCYISKYLNKTEKNVVVPPVIDGHIVRNIWDKSFANNKAIETLTLEYDKDLGDKELCFEVISDKAFKNCSSLKKVTINTGTNIGAEAFMNCSSLKSVTLKMCSDIDNKAFFNCPDLKKVTVYGEIKSAGDHALGYYRTKSGKLKFNKDLKVVCKTTERFMKRYSDEPYRLYNNNFGHSFNSVFSIEQNSFFKKYSQKNYCNLIAGAEVQLLYKGKKLNTWKSSDTKHLKITKNGKCVSVSEGKATLSFTENNRKHSFTVKTWDPFLQYSKGYVRHGETQAFRIKGKVKGYDVVYYKDKAGIASFVNPKPDKSTFTVKGLKRGKTTLKLKVNGVLLKLKLEVS